MYLTLYLVSLFTTKSRSAWSRFDMESTLAYGRSDSKQEKVQADIHSFIPTQQL